MPLQVLDLDPPLPKRLVQSLPSELQNVLKFPNIDQVCKDFPQLAKKNPKDIVIRKKLEEIAVMLKSIAAILGNHDSGVETVNKELPSNRKERPLRLYTPKLNKPKKNKKAKKLSKRIIGRQIREARRAKNPQAKNLARITQTNRKREPNLKKIIEELGAQHAEIIQTLSTSQQSLLALLLRYEKRTQKILPLVAITRDSIDSRLDGSVSRICKFIITARILETAPASANTATSLNILKIKNKWPQLQKVCEYFYYRDKNPAAYKQAQPELAARRQQFALTIKEFLANTYTPDGQLKDQALASANELIQTLETDFNKILEDQTSSQQKKALKIFKKPKFSIESVLLDIQSGLYEVGIPGIRYLFKVQTFAEDLQNSKLGYNSLAQIFILANSPLRTEVDTEAFKIINSSKIRGDARRLIMTLYKEYQGQKIFNQKLLKDLLKKHNKKASLIIANIKRQTEVKVLQPRVLIPATVIEFKNFSKNNPLKVAEIVYLLMQSHNIASQQQPFSAKVLPELLRRMELGMLASIFERQLGLRKDNSAYQEQSHKLLANLFDELCELNESKELEADKIAEVLKMFNMIGFINKANLDLSIDNDLKTVDHSDKKSKTSVADGKIASRRKLNRDLAKNTRPAGQSKAAKRKEEVKSRPEVLYPALAAAMDHISDDSRNSRLQLLIDNGLELTKYTDPDAISELPRLGETKIELWHLGVYGSEPATRDWADSIEQANLFVDGLDVVVKKVTAEVFFGAQNGQRLENGFLVFLNHLDSQNQRIYQQLVESKLGLQ